MELRQVQYFLALGQEKSFTRAAKHCGVSQPSLSAAIKSLEQELGGQLFHRNRGNCPLSELGQQVWPHLAKLDQCARDTRKQAAHFTASRTSATALEPVPSIPRLPMHGDLVFIWATQKWRKRRKIRRPLYLIGAGAVAAAAIVIWSQNVLVSSSDNAVSAFLLPLRAPLKGATETPPPGTEIDVSGMHQNIINLPEHKYDDMTFVFSKVD